MSKKNKENSFSPLPIGERVRVRGVGPVPRTGRKEQTPNRPSWDEYFLDIAGLVSTRSTCLRRRVGAVIVKDKRLLSTGYNGAPTGIRHCFETGCLREKLKVPSGERHELCRGLHAEQNALLQASLYGVSLKDSTLYCTNQPCIICAKMLINAGIREIVIKSFYPDKMAKEFLDEAGIAVRILSRKEKLLHQPKRKNNPTVLRRRLG